MSKIKNYDIVANLQQLKTTIMSINELSGYQKVTVLGDIGYGHKGSILHCVALK